MKKSSLIKAVFLFSFCIVTVESCIRKDVTNISDNLHYQPTFSAPITTSSFSINNYFENIDTLVPGYPDFVYYNDSLLPNYAKSVSFDEQVQFDFSSLGTWINQVNYAMFRLNITNGFPTEAALQVYFADNSQAVFDSLITSGPLSIPPGEISQNGKVIQPYQGQYDIELNELQLNELTDIRFFLTKGVVNTTRQDIDTVKFYPGYRLSMQIGLRLGLDVQTGN
jgi:hypothetical protein